jgi:hypothetical protein
MLSNCHYLLACMQITIAYPDEGAWKRFHYSFKNEGFPEVGGWRRRGVGLTKYVPKAPGTVW